LVGSSLSCFYGSSFPSFDSGFVFSSGSFGFSSGLSSTFGFSSALSFSFEAASGSVHLVYL
jgi:hypothetical protein